MSELADRLPGRNAIPSAIGHSSVMAGDHCTVFRHP
jgi:hypothetical protein